ncbi:UDP-N-acetylmuramoyl-tripeptide--D-alanyl-D-alanine ligase [Taurinivorans muris]|uniref:UDP-N-acetylmuramoyl-tripeptide--D-alanyl-D-alanine ligase n=1 Tax=Taurinivorans muris TaxID=2787751 RepID=A0ABY5Y0R4_9BACT|nr:UDP-N-acetylmuramoyl-tripeptide--D-alanyl-D-alanine ligase [Desulfovibrionaceae bacterium LT0009]
MQITVSQALQDCDAVLLYDKEYENLSFDGAAYDNRLVQKNNLFVCIKGENNDGHNFAKDAVARGASAVLAEKNPFGENPPVPVLLVENSVKALGLLACKARLRFGEDKTKKVIGITGTAGKTSVKELIAHILSMEEDLSFNEKNVAKNPLNYNTQIGMPVSILNASGKEKYWVFELGISHAEDMDELGRILWPDMAVILNAATGHSEGLGDMGVAYYKAQLLNFLPQNGSAYVSGDYPDLFVHACYNKTDTKFFSTSSKKIPYQGKYLGVTEQGLGKYSLTTPTHSFEAESIYVGEYGAENCIAAASLALELGFSEEQIQKALRTVQAPAMRFNKHELGQWTLIDDTYNANPLSAARMLESAGELAEDKDFILVFGEMKELGDLAEQEHEEFGKLAAQKNPLAVFFKGSFAPALQKGLAEHNYTGIFSPLENTEKFMEEIKKLPFTHAKHLIVFKGSRSNHLEEYVKAFTEQNNAV